MGKLTIRKEQSIFNDNILARQERVVIDYSIFFEEKPSFVTYYQQNIIRSSRESTLEDTTALLGSDSPILFDMIDDFPIYKLSGIDSISVDAEDFGKQTNITGEGVIIPRTIEPREDDFFVLTYDTRRYLFVIVDVNIDSIAGLNYYKINFKLDYRNEEEIKSQLSGEEFITDYDNIGTEYKTVISKPDRLVTEFLANTQRVILEFISDNYYYEFLDYLKFTDDSGQLMYDPILVKFAVDNNLLMLFNAKEQLSSIYLNNVDFGDTYEKILRKDYKATIYAALENKSVANVTKINFSKWPMENPDSMTLNELTFEGRAFLITMYDLYTVTLSDFIIFDDQLVPNLQSGTLYADAVHVVENIIIDHMHNRLNKDNLITVLSEISLDDDEYRSLPLAMILLFIVKYYFNNLLEFKKVM